MNETPPILVEISPGELWDKITILRLKSERINDAAKVENVQRELAMLESVVVKASLSGPVLGALVRQLSQVNRALWDVEDEIRDCERQRDFGARFVELARSVYRHNDKRGEFKLQINTLLGARIVEEKQYVKYD
jgi:hypothetical protein